ncbi:MAG TPA: hypothetical protein VE591_12105, partial [Candidatus Acidoferrum sp.]|nr:hypothetical protein [Candidatus Acidoferrum sp.]
MFQPRALVLLLAATLAGAAKLPVAPAPPPVRPVTETHYGVTYSDWYRYFEDRKDPGLARYFKAQSTYTRQVLDGLSGRAALAHRIAQLDNAAETIAVPQPAGSTYFYLKRPRGANTTRIYARAIGGGAERLVFDPDRFAHAGQHYTVDFYSPSFDGRYLAVGTSEGGSENTTLHVVETRTGALLADVIDRTPFSAPTWRPDGRSFYYYRTPKLPPNAPQSDRDTRGVTRLHVLGRDPERDPAIFGFGLSKRIPIAPEDATAVVVSPRSPFAVAIVEHGVQNELMLYAAPAASASRPHAPWRRIVGYADDVTDFALAGNTLYLSSHLHASRHRILALDLRIPILAHARVVVPQSSRVIESLATARDAIYLRDLEGGISKLRRLVLRPDGSAGAISTIALPFSGAIGALAAEPRAPGAVFDLQSWTQSPRL